MLLEVRAIALFVAELAEEPVERRERLGLVGPSGVVVIPVEPVVAQARSDCSMNSWASGRSTVRVSFWKNWIACRPLRG